jgi:hypothetical protein
LVWERQLLGKCNIDPNGRGGREAERTLMAGKRNDGVRHRLTGRAVSFGTKPLTAG